MIDYLGRVKQKKLIKNKKIKNQAPIIKAVVTRSQVLWEVERLLILLKLNLTAKF